MATAYEDAAGLMGKASDIYSGLSNGTTGTQAGQSLADQMLGMLPNEVTQAGTTVGNYGPQDINAGIAGSMNQYLNPYYDQVLDASLGKMKDVRDQNLNAQGAAATAAGAFGGSRHGLAEGQIYSDYTKNAGELAANLKTQGFNTALGAAQSGMSQELNRGQFLSGTQAQLDASKAGFDANAALQLGMARPGTYGQGYQIGMAGQNQNFQQQSQNAGNLANLGGQYYGVGQDITQQQNTQGTQIQDMLQKVLSGGAGQFDQYMQNPYQAMNMMQSLLQGDPRNNNTSATSTSQSNPGMMGWMSMLLGGLQGSMGK